MSTHPPTPSPRVWWSNAIFFVGIHFLALYYLCIPKFSTLLLTLLFWQIANFGITIGYHRLYSHRSFTAHIAVRIVLAAIGASGLQGSIKWWCLRHRLHHRFTDDPVHDPYAATRGLFFSHMGWIFFKPRYEKLDTIDKSDLERDPVVRYQHKYYILIALLFGIIIPTIIGCMWCSFREAFVWTGLISRIATWHTTFIVNSLAHWEGLQPYSDEVTAKGNLWFALITAGEGNHNYHHTFPHDYRAGPNPLDFDPSKWVIVMLSKLSLVHNLRRARTEDVVNAKRWNSTALREEIKRDNVDLWQGALWTPDQAKRFCKEDPSRRLLVIDGYFVDATLYMREHPGGAKLLSSHSFNQSVEEESATFYDATPAFRGGYNNHSRIAESRLRRLRVAKLSAGPETSR